MKRIVVLALALIAVAVSALAEEIKLSTIVPDQQLVRGKDGAIGNTYRQKTDADVPDNDLIVEGKVGIGTEKPNKKLEVETLHTVNVDDEIRIGSYFKGNFCGLGMNYRINDAGTISNHIVDYDLGTRHTDITIHHGNVGIGTTSPSQKLEVYGNILLGENGENSFIHGGARTAFSSDSSVLIVADSNDTDGPAGSDGTNPDIIFGAGSAFDTDTTRTFTFSDAYPASVPRIEFMRIKAKTGNVGIGTTDPEYTLDVAGIIRSNNVSASDLRWKENIAILDNPLQKISRLRGIEFDWKRKEFKENNFPEGRQIGMIAQEVEKEFPQLVSTDGKGYKSIAYDRFTAVLLEAIKEQQKEIQSQQAQIDALNKKISNLE